MSRTQYWLVTLLSIASLILLVTNAFLLHGNRGLQREVASRQQYVQQSVQLEGLYREIVRSLAELAARNNDADVRAMLSKHGISYTVNPPAAPATPPAASAAPARK